MTDTEEAEQAQASTSQSASETDCDTPWPAYSEIFTFEPKLSTEKNFAFTCKLCLDRKVYQANKTTTSNLRKHAKISKKFKQFYPMFYVESNVQHRIIKHPRYLEKIDEAKSNKLTNNKRQKENEDISNNSVTKKQCVLQKWGSGITGITQKKLDGAILRFVIENIQPLAVVESPAFIDLVKIGLPSSFRIMCRKTLREKLCQLYSDMKTALENELAKIEYISTTADLWSKAKRESAGLACRRMKGRHTFDVLAKEINSVFLEYHIQNKVCCVTTDNGSNFVKAFRDFARDENIENDDDETVDMEFYNLSDLLITDEIQDLDTEDFITLPPHHRCVSHTLSLVAVKDSEKALESALYKKKQRPTFAKLTKLWSKQNQSTQVADKIKDICGIYLKTPVVTRWNSTFDCVCQLMTLLKDGSEKVNQCLDYCSLSRLTNDDIKFLDEYCQVMEPLAKALDILQSDTGMYMGYLLPVLYSLQEKLDNITDTIKLTYCNPLITAIEEGLNRRFCTTFEKKELIIASCLHPKFKLNWLIGEKKKLAESYLEDLLDIRSNDNSLNSDKNDDYDDFFTFHRQSTSTSESGEEELQRFLKSKRTDIELLNDFPKLKKLFIKFNTALPSSASVERMFSIDNSVCQPSRGRLHDNIMEYQLLLKINKKYK
ncbi:uncharacterized protein [Temnothorax longispinosus]|uniref:uncharacterized protein isoform X2 n=1 Tax=Temnothorax longispinosus TaxID=300112 RepID=UPI003A992EC6